VLGASAFAGRSSARPRTRFGEGRARRFPRRSRGAGRLPSMVSRQPPPSSARFGWPSLHRFTTARTEQVPRRHSQLTLHQRGHVGPARASRRRKGRQARRGLVLRGERGSTAYTTGAQPVGDANRHAARVSPTIGRSRYVSALPVGDAIFCGTSPASFVTVPTPLKA
jgi:hypothetical protein